MKASGSALGRDREWRCRHGLRPIGTRNVEEASMFRCEAFNRRFDAAREMVRAALVRRRGAAPVLLTIASAVCLGLATAAPAMELVSVDLFNQTGNAPSA